MNIYSLAIILQPNLQLLSDGREDYSYNLYVWQMPKYPEQHFLSIIPLSFDQILFDL